MTTGIPPAPANAVMPQTVAHQDHWQPVPAPPVEHPAVSYPYQGGTVVPDRRQPGAYHPAYPTAPPWAVAPAHGGRGRPARHGGLLVPYPDEMQHASRERPPAVWPVAVLTLLFSVFGLASAKRRAGRARLTRNPTAPYWIAFFVSAVTGVLVWSVVAGPLLAEVRENQRLEAVQRNVVGDGQLKDARIEVTAAQCRAVTERGADGMRDYLCRLSLAGGKTGSLALTADESGQWMGR